VDRIQWFNRSGRRNRDPGSSAVHVHRSRVGHAEDFDLDN
jgi:hypothetical protein